MWDERPGCQDYWGGGSHCHTAGHNSRQIAQLLASLQTTPTWSRPLLGTQTEMQILIFHALSPSVQHWFHFCHISVFWTDFDLPFDPKLEKKKKNFYHFCSSKVCSTLKITWMSQYKQYRVVFPPLISIDISPPCFSSKSTLISLINRPHYGQDCQKYFYLPRNILYCVNISLCLYFLWLSITATTNVSSAYKSIVLPPTK